jgi:hypothetical protein
MCIRAVSGLAETRWPGTLSQLSTPYAGNKLTSQDSGCVKRAILAETQSRIKMYDGNDKIKKIAVLQWKLKDDIIS